MTILNSYKTKQKELILKCLIKNKDKHVTVDELLRYIRNEKENVGRTTVYRYLDKLVSQGLVRKYNIEEGNSSCYQYIENSENCHEHYHLKCLNCGQLMHIECKSLDEVNADILDDYNFSIDNSKTVFYGQCGNCKAKV